MDIHRTQSGSTCLFALESTPNSSITSILECNTSNTTYYIIVWAFDLFQNHKKGVNSSKFKDMILIICNKHDMKDGEHLDCLK